MRGHVRDYDLKKGGKLWAAIVTKANVSYETGNYAIRTAGYADFERGRQHRLNSTNCFGPSMTARMLSS